MNIKKTNLLIILTIILAMVAGFAISKCYTNETNTIIKVDGFCSTPIKRDRISITITIRDSNSDQDVVTATQNINKIYNTLSQYVNELKKQYPNIEMSINEYSIKEGKHILQSIDITITADNIQAINSIVKEVSKFKKAYLYKFETFVSNDVIEKAKQKCFEQAIKNAKAQAVSIANAVGQKVGKMTEIKIYDNLNLADESNYLASISDPINGFTYITPTFLPVNGSMDYIVNAKFELK